MMGRLERAHVWLGRRLLAGETRPMPGGSWPARCWRRLSQLDGRLARRMEIITEAVSPLPLLLWATGVPSSVALGVALAWMLLFILILPSSIGQMRRIWREGTKMQHRARILRAHAAELRELNDELMS